MSDLFTTGVRPAIDAYLKARSEEKRDYGDYWSASSAGFCMRLNIMRRLGVPKVPELDDNAALTRTFESGHIFHEWLQRITRDAGLSIASEVELIHEGIKVKGHFDDLILINKQLIMYDYKTAHSGSFDFKKRQATIGDYHRMQLGTYMYMWRHPDVWLPKNDWLLMKDNLREGRILSISKDDLRLDEKQLLWDARLEKDVVGYWRTLNGYWENKKLPACTCDKFDGGFMARRSKKGKIYNDFMYKNPNTGIEEPCSIEWYQLWKDKQNAV